MCAYYFTFVQKRQYITAIKTVNAKLHHQMCKSPCTIITSLKQAAQGSECLKATTFSEFC